MTSRDGNRLRPPAPFVLHGIALLLFLALAALFLAPALIGDRALLPTELLMQMSPWAETAIASTPPGEAQPPWNPLLWDAMAQFYPWRAFAAHWMRQGIIPLWDLHQFCGTPFLANSQSAVLYPLHFLLLYLPVGLHAARAMVLLAWAHMTLAGFLTYLFLRGLRVRWFAAFLGGVTFMLSGFVVTWLELPSFLTVACWLPLLLLTIHRLTDAPTAGRAAAVGGVVGLHLLGGHLQIAFYCLLGAGIYTAARLLERRREIPLLRTAGLLIAAGALGVMLAGPQLLPAMELSRLSHRVSQASAEGYALYVRGAMPTGHLVRLFLPDFYGNPTRGDYIAGSPADYTELAGHVGSVGLLMALIALLAWRRRPAATATAAALAAFSLLLALGTPLNALLYFGIPGFSQSGSPARVLVLFCFAAAWLAALGIETLMTDLPPQPGPGAPPHRDPRLLALLLWLALLAAALLLARTWVTTHGGTFAPFLAVQAPSLGRALLFALLAVGLPLGLSHLVRGNTVSPGLARSLGLGGLTAVLISELWLHGFGFNPTGPLSQVYPATPLTQALQDRSAPGSPRVLPVNRRWSLLRHPHAVLPPNSALALGLTDPQGYDSLFLGSYKGLSNLIAGPGADSAPPENGNMLFVSNLTSSLLPLLAADRLVLSSHQPPAGQGAPLPPAATGAVLHDSGGVQVRRYDRALPRAFVAPDWRSTTDARAGDELQQLAAAGALETTALVHGGGERAGKGGRGGAVGWRPLGPNRVTIEIGKGVGPGMLMLLDNHAPGWRAVDGHNRPLQVYRADLTFRAVPVTAETQIIEMRYQPATFRLGLYLAMLSVTCLGAAGAAAAGQAVSSRSRR